MDEDAYFDDGDIPERYYYSLPKIEQSGDGLLEAYDAGDELLLIGDANRPWIITVEICATLPPEGLEDLICNTRRIEP